MSNPVTANPIDFNTVAVSTLNSSPSSLVAPDDPRVQDVLSEAIAFFHRDTALNFGLYRSRDRFYIARDYESSGITVPPGALVLIDDIHNWQVAIPLVDGASIVPHILQHLGLAHPAEQHVIQAKIPALPWFASAAPIHGAQTYVLGHWVSLDPARGLQHARELGVADSERWFAQTNGVLCWIRDAANNFTYEADEGKLERGIRVFDVLRLPELKDMPGVMVHGRNSYRPLASGESWSRPVSPVRVIETPVDDVVVVWTKGTA